LCFTKEEYGAMGEMEKKQTLAKKISPKLLSKDGEKVQSEELVEMDPQHLVGLANLVLHNETIDAQAEEGKTEGQFINKVTDELVQRTKLNPILLDRVNPHFLALMNCKNQKGTNEDNSTRRGRGLPIVDVFMHPFNNLVEKINPTTAAVTASVPICKSDALVSGKNCLCGATSCSNGNVCLEKTNGGIFCANSSSRRQVLIIQHIQHDFISGNLVVKGADKKISVIASLAKKPIWQHVILTHDWHPANHISFYSNLHLFTLDPAWILQNENISKSQIVLGDQVTYSDPLGKHPIKQYLWPDHCIQNSFGARFHEDLQNIPNSRDLLTGSNSNMDAYSSFFDNSEHDDNAGDTGLHSMLKQKEIQDLVVVGIATDFAVGRTALDALQLGYHTTILRDASSFISAQGEMEMINKVRNKGGKIMTVDDWLLLLDINLT